MLFHRQDVYLLLTILYVVEINSCPSTGFAGLKGLYFLKAQLPPPFNSSISTTVSAKEALPVCYGRFVSFTFAPGDIFMKVGQATGHCFCNMAELIPADNVALQVICQRTLQKRTLSVFNCSPLYVTDVPTVELRMVWRVLEKSEPWFNEGRGKSKKKVKVKRRNKNQKCPRVSSP